MRKKPNKTWDDIALAAHRCGVPAITVAVWKHRGFIPMSEHHRIVKAANRLGLSRITTNALYRMCVKSKNQGMHLCKTKNQQPKTEANNLSTQ